MIGLLTPDICVIGAGTAGLVTAAGASQLGAETVLIEAAQMGGDCLNTGCVPSKSLLAAAHAAVAHRRAADFGLSQGAAGVDFAKVHAHVRGVIRAIAPNDSDAWDTLAQTQLDIEDLDRLAQTLDAWQKVRRPPAAAIEDFRGDLCLKRKDYQNAERHWLAFLATKPRGGGEVP